MKFESHCGVICCIVCCYTGKPTRDFGLAQNILEETSQVGTGVRPLNIFQSQNNFLHPKFPINAVCCASKHRHIGGTCLSIAHQLPACLLWMVATKSLRPEELFQWGDQRQVLSRIYSLGSSCLGAAIQGHLVCLHLR